MQEALEVVEGRLLVGLHFKTGFIRIFFMDGLIHGLNTKVVTHRDFICCSKEDNILNIDLMWPLGSLLFW